MACVSVNPSLLLLQQQTRLPHVSARVVWCFDLSFVSCILPICPIGAEQEGGQEGPGLRRLKGQQLEVKEGDADKDRDFNLADLDNCTVTM